MDRVIQIDRRSELDELRRSTSWPPAADHLPSFTGGRLKGVEKTWAVTLRVASS